MKSAKTIQTAIVLAVILLLGLAALALAQPAYELAWSNTCAGEVRVRGFVVECWEEGASVPTATPEPLPTDTPAPTATPTQPPAGPVDPYLDAPLCETHDANAWHGLWDYERGCHYNHTHGDDPHAVDAIFGTAIFDEMGGEISYPWATSGENHVGHKHEGYVWLVRTGETCFSQFASGCITDFRTLVHADLHNVASDYHSYVLEARVCEEANPANCGTVRVGGWQASGDVTINETTAYDRNEQALAPYAPRPVFLHYAPPENYNFSTWYPVSPWGWARVSVEVGDMWGYFPQPAAPFTVAQDLQGTFTFICARGPDGHVGRECKNNASDIAPHVIGFTLSPRNLRALGLAGATHATWAGYLDRYGQVAQGCAEIGLDCVPLTLENVPVAGVDQYQYRGSARDYDLYEQPDGALVWGVPQRNTSVGWIQ